MSLDRAIRLLDRLLDAGYPESTAKKIVSGELPMSDTSRFARAGEQATDTSRELFHWTNRDFNEFQPSTSGKFGQGVYLSPRPYYGEKYVERGDPRRMSVFGPSNIAKREDINSVEKSVLAAMKEQNVPPMAMGDTFWNMVQDKLKEKGFDALEFGDEVVVFDPARVRDVRAAFDPANVGKPNILGGAAPVAAGGVLAGSMNSEAAVKQLDTIMAGGMKTPAEQAQAVISGQSLTPQGPTFSGPVNKTIADNLVASPDVGSIQATQPGSLRQLAGDVGFALQDFGKSAQDAGPLGFLAGSAIESTGDIAQRYAYGESEVYDPALLGLNALGLTPAAFMSSGMRGAMRNPDAKYSIFKELFGN